MSSLYRFISFPCFISVIENKSERYVLPVTWEDTYEGYLLRLFNEENTEDILLELMKTFSENNLDAALDNYIRLWASRWMCYGQCWTNCAESDAFWRIYSYNKMAIRIETDEQQICSLFATPKYSNKFSLEIADVQYDLDRNGRTKSRGELLQEMKNTKRIIEPYFHKRQAFEHEQEKRVILLDKEGYSICDRFFFRPILNNYRRQGLDKIDSLNDRIGFLSSELRKLFYLFLKKSALQSTTVVIPNIGSYIKSVMVHPQAEDWIVSLIEMICKRASINFAGKSCMYDGIN